MKIAIISGSHRPQSQSAKIARFLEGRLQGMGTEPWVYALGEEPLPLWDEGMWQEEWPDHWQKQWKPLSEKLAASEGAIFIAPEWSGIVPPALKNFFLLLGDGHKGELAHKPALIVGVSASGNGVYPVSELRMSSYKNTRVCYIPDHLIVRNAPKILNAEGPAEGFEGEDAYMKERIDYTLGILLEYAKALKSVRASGKAATEKFVFGM